MRVNHRPRTDAGFTLIELLIVISVLSVLLVPLTSVIISVIINHRTTTERMSLSHDQQIMSSYFAGDVSIIGVRDTVAAGNPFKTGVQTGASYQQGGYTCGTGSTHPAGAALRLLGDTWKVGATAPITTIVVYYVKDTELRRMVCEGSASPQTDIVVAHNVVPASVEVTCDTTCTAAGPPRTVALALTVIDPKPAGTQGNAGEYKILVTGERRQT
jgi:prepilin-type N-terminal cleavage/methylation domain-containing protein